jgi:hypothetical protein
MGDCAELPHERTALFAEAARVAAVLKGGVKLISTRC